MLSKAAMEFLLQVTHWINGHWEDPEWGKRPLNQVMVLLAIRELASGIQDKELLGEIRAAAEKGVARHAQLIVKG